MADVVNPVAGEVATERASTRLSLLHTGPSGGRIFNLTTLRFALITPAPIIAPALILVDSFTLSLQKFEFGFLTGTAWDPPRELREAALALRIPQWRTIVSVVVPSAMAGIATGVILAFARAAGETAALLFTSFGNRFWSTTLTKPIASLTVQVYTYVISPFPDWQRQAWAGALVLTIIVLSLELGVRWVTGGRARATH